MKLLIVDDNAEVRRMIVNIFEKYFDELIECSDGSEAINLYGQYQPDWVLMDIKMKNIDGFNAAKKILKNYSDAKIIIISQYKDESFREEAIKAGALEFVEKENLLKIFEIIKTTR